MANVISTAKKVAVISALVEGCSVRSTVRLTGVSKGAVLRLLASVGKACQEYQDVTIRNVPAKRVQVDEIWSFCYAKEKNATAAMWRKLDMLATFGHSPRLTLTRSSLSVGLLAGGTRGVQRTSFRMLLAGCRIESS
jgi:hypothetical protein